MKYCRVSGTPLLFQVQTFPIYRDIPLYRDCTFLWGHTGLKYGTKSKFLGMRTKPRVDTYIIDVRRVRNDSALKVGIGGLSVSGKCDVSEVTKCMKMLILTHWMHAYSHILGWEHLLQLSCESWQFRLWKSPYSIKKREKHPWTTRTQSIRFSALLFSDGAHTLCNRTL